VEREGGRHLADSRDEDWDFVMGINCTGVFHCLRAELNKMLDNGGSIVCTCPCCVPFSIVTTNHNPYTGQHFQRCWLHRCCRHGHI
jgi:NADP-dependent 3-hydroxy acid dehydrogenase YdfG